MSNFKFEPSLIKFLKELKANNNRDWFNANKQRYENEVRTPVLDFITEMRKPFKSVSPHFIPIAKKVGGSMMRPYRDTRFSKDKTPYKTNVGIHVRHEFGKDVHAPGFYLHIAVDDCFMGAGIWHPESDALKKIRVAIDEEPTKWKRAKSGKKFTQHFELAGDSLKRPPRDFDKEHPLIDDLKRKDHIGLLVLKESDLLKSTIVKDTIDKFKAAKPYMRFLCDALRIPF